MHTRSTKTLHRMAASYSLTNRESFQFSVFSFQFSVFSCPWMIFSFRGAVNLGLGSFGVLLK